MMIEAVRLAVEVLSEVELRRKSEKLAMSEVVTRMGIRDAGTIGFAHRLVMETLKHIGLVDEIAKKVLSEGGLSPTELRARTRAFLRLLIYRAAVEKAGKGRLLDFVRAGREALGRKALKPVEAFLGRCLTVSAEEALSGKHGDDRISLELSVPKWLFKRFCRDLGRREAISFLKASLGPLPTYVRLNTLKEEEERILRRLRGEKVELEPVEEIKHVYKVISSEKPLVLTKAYGEGLFYIQDKASCLAVEVADPKPGQVVLDVCAAPGAKTTHLAQLMGNRGRIISVDISDRRMKAWDELVARMGVRIAEPLLADARFDLPLRLQADIVLLDPPCTATGSFARTPSAKWRLTPRSARNMARIQARMLHSCSKHVKPGGSLVYANCTLTLEENELVIEAFLRTHPDFELEPLNHLGSPGLRGLEAARRLSLIHI